MFLDEIFGSKHTSGLVDAVSAADFDERLENLRKIWTVRDPSRSFDQYIMNKADMMKTSLIAEQHVNAGLGSLPIKFYTNQSESINFRLKCATRFRESGLVAFIKTMRDLAQVQEEEIRKVYCNVSKKFVVHTDFQEQLLCKNYFSLSALQRKEFLKKSASYSIADLHTLAVGTSVVSNAVQDDSFLDVTPTEPSSSSKMKRMKLSGN